MYTNRLLVIYYLQTSCRMLQRYIQLSYVGCALRECAHWLFVGNKGNSFFSKSFSDLNILWHLSAAQALGMHAVAGESDHYNLLCFFPPEFSGHACPLTVFRLLIIVTKEGIWVFWARFSAAWNGICTHHGRIHLQDLVAFANDHTLIRFNWHEQQLAITWF